MFPILKLLTFLPFGSFLRGGTFKLVAIVGLVGVLAFGYWKWKDSIQDAVRDDINAQLLEERINQQQRQTEILMSISEQQNRIMQAAIERNQALIRSLEQHRITIGGMEASPATAPLEAAMDAIRKLEAAGAKLRDPPPAPEGVDENTWIEAWKKKFGVGS